MDLVETFDWLLGLKVKHVDRISGFLVVEGENPKSEKVLVIWRKVRDLDETDPEKVGVAREKANRDLEAFFRKQQYNTLDSEFDVIYVNGDRRFTPGQVKVIREIKEYLDKGFTLAYASRLARNRN